MKILLAIIITTTLSFGCAMLEGEQTTTDSGGGGTTSAPSTPSPAVASWSGIKQLGTSSNDYAKGIATDSSGNVYLTGYTQGGLDGNTSAGSTDLFVVKYDSSGVKQWTKQLGTSTGDYANSIATDSSGNIYVTGETLGSLGGSNAAGRNGHTRDILVVKYDNSGTKQWTQQLGTSPDDYANGIATDSSGNVYVTGHTGGGLAGPTNAGWEDFFVVKYDSSGNKQ
jgi:hypothetical protein